MYISRFITIVLLSACACGCSCATKKESMTTTTTHSESAVTKKAATAKRPINPRDPAGPRRQDAETPPGD
jgi:hypothetical protein